MGKKNHSDNAPIPSAYMHHTFCFVIDFLFAYGVKVAIVNTYAPIISVKHICQPITDSVINASALKVTCGLL